MGADDNAEPRIVTLRSLGQLASRESVAEAVKRSELEPVRQALALNRYARILEKLQKETAASDPDVMVTVQDREASLLQSRVASEGTETDKLPAGGEEVKFGDRLEDLFGWALSLLDWVDRTEAHELVRPASIVVDPLPGLCRIAMLADWGTGLYGAPVSAQSIAETGSWDLLMHLGDVYYSGTEEETNKRFLERWPIHAGTVSRAINGNHEMYSGGYAYFEHTLPKFEQSASYFALANANWLLIGLDTAYVDHAIDDTQVGWVHSVIKDHGNGRKIVLFSHQQPFSRLSQQGPKIETALGPLLESGAVTAWYWGHEHDCVIYDAHPTYGLLGRCLGNGGIPAFRRKEVKAAPTELTAADIMWKRLDATADSPPCLVLDGPNHYVVGKEEKFLPHGYVTLELDGPSLTERFHLPDGTAVYCNEIG